VSIDGKQRVRAILHVDMDAFYASVEVMDNPSLAGKPVIVGGTPETRGVVAAASYEARKFGVHSAMSSYRAHQLCPHGVFILPRMSRYVEMSREIHRVFESYTPLIEPISIDEAFLDVSGSVHLFGPAEAIGERIRERVRSELGLPISVGAARTKHLAKIASQVAKPDGLVVVSPAGEREFRATLLDYFDEMTRLSHHLLRAFARVRDPVQLGADGIVDLPLPVPVQVAPERGDAVGEAGKRSRYGFR
jgi:nucleotidyltransferase/DNA polymerase involved in DNA repair